jgi:A/G-specific adenine glycosylase
MLSEFSRRLIEWYALNARSLPWRGLSDPYAVWVSEIMLQQTRVETVIPYFERWLKRFPTLKDLAEASQEDVLKTWEGLGYYSRARNLHKAAGLVMEHFSGQLPRDRKELGNLPGIGAYTAGAIASIAFGQDEATLDGNIRRVLARFFNISDSVKSTEGKQKLWNLARDHLPMGKAGEYNQGLMDLGAAICTPRSPACSRCPLEDFCQARALGIQEQLPVGITRPAIPHIIVTAAVIEREGKVLIARRPANGLLGGMWEFPGGKLEEGENLEECLIREIREELGTEIVVDESFGIYNHAYTHFKVTLHAFLTHLGRADPVPLQTENIRWVFVQELNTFPMGKIDRQIALALQQTTS